MSLAALIANGLVQNLAVGIVTVPLLWLVFRRFSFSASTRAAAWAGVIIASVVFPVGWETVAARSAASSSSPPVTDASHARSAANPAGAAVSALPLTISASPSAPVAHAAGRVLFTIVPVAIPAGILSVIAIGWAVFAAAMMAILAIQYCLLQAELRRLPSPTAEQSVRLAAALATTELRRPVRFAVAEAYAAPAVAGLGRPVIIVPSEVLATADSAELERIVMHEAAHLARRDDYIDLGVRIVLALAFFNPALWLARRLLEVDREVACDDHVIRERRDGREYAMLLVRIARGPRPSAGLSLRSSSEQLAKRVESIMDARRNRDLRSVPGIVAAGAIAIVPWLLALTIHVASASPVDATAGGAARDSTEHAQYLTEMAPGASLQLYNYAGGVRVDEARGNTLSVDGRAAASPESAWPMMKFSGSKSAPVACALARASATAKCSDETVLDGPVVPSIDWLVSLPGGRGISIHDGRGPIIVRSSGDIEIRDGDGDIDAAGSTVDAATQRGNIVAKMSSSSLARSATLDAQHGTLVLTVPRALRAQIVATSLSGTIHSAIPLRFDEKRGSNALTGRAVVENATGQQRLVLTAGSSIEIIQQ